MLPASSQRKRLSLFLLLCLSLPWLAKRSLVTLSSVCADRVCSAAVCRASGDGTAKLWNAATGECVFTLRKHTQAIHAIAFHPTNSTLVTGSGDASVCLWTVNVCTHCP